MENDDGSPPQPRFLHCPLHSCERLEDVLVPTFADFASQKHKRVFVPRLGVSVEGGGHVVDAVVVVVFVHFAFEDPDPNVQVSTNILAVPTLISASLLELVVDQKRYPPFLQNASVPKGSGKQLQRAPPENPGDAVHLPRFS